MSGKIGIYTQGLWRLRHDVATVTGLKPVRRWYGTRGLDAVTGWGFKPTADHARRLAARNGLPYLAIEDGFLRSRRPGPKEATFSYVCDRIGIYYDSSRPSALEALARARMADIARAERDAEPIIHAITKLGLSKYTDVDRQARHHLFAIAEHRAPVIVVDQTVGDAAVTGAGADRSTFLAMLLAAVVEHPDAPVLLKTHPETRLGRRAGYLDGDLLAEARTMSPAVAEAMASGRLGFFTDAIAPCDLAAAARQIYVVSSLLGFETLIAGARLSVFGNGFYAGWGLTDDRVPQIERRCALPLACLVSAAYRDYLTFLCPGTRKPCQLECILRALSRATVMSAG
jgi:capsular polysaccharide export protein